MTLCPQFTITSNKLSRAIHQHCYFHSDYWAHSNKQKHI